MPDTPPSAGAVNSRATNRGQIMCYLQTSICRLTATVPTHSIPPTAGGWRGPRATRLTCAVLAAPTGLQHGGQGADVMREEGQTVGTEGVHVTTVTAF